MFVRCFLLFAMAMGTAHAAPPPMAPETTVLQAGGAAGERAPEIRSTDHNGRPVVLSALLEKGPVILVFYRGYW